MNIERCSKFSENKLKDNPVGAATANRTRTAPVNVEPITLKKDTGKVTIVIWK
jgi:hypothetical protein